MEPETITPPSPISPPAADLSKFTPKSKLKLLPVFGGIAVILFSIALGIIFFGKDKTTTPTTTSSSSDIPITEQAVGWPKYNNADFFYEIGVPPEWTQIKLSPLNKDTAMWDADDIAILEIVAKKNISSIDEYLNAQDEANKNTVRSTGSTQVKVGAYDGYERAESWPTLGLQAISTYVKIQDMLYVFTLSPARSQSAVTNDSIIRDYHAMLASFRLTETSQLGLDLKEYSSKKVAGLAFSAFSLEYPQTWVLTETPSPSSLELSIYRNNYELTISQKAVGGAVCLFSDSPSFEGTSGDLRNKQYIPLATISDYIFRRYFNQNHGEKSTFYFCQQTSDSAPVFETPTSFGGIVYNVPAKYDPDIIKEMDEIVRSITPNEN